MNKDAFAFANFGDTTDASKLTAAEVARLFGAAKVCVGGTAVPCTLTAPAQNWLTSANLFLTNGRCEGFSILSQLAFVKKIDPAAFGAANTHALAVDDNAPLQHELAYWATTQILPPTPDDQPQQLSAKEAVTFFETALKGNTGKIYRIGMADLHDGVAAGAHSVAPIGIDQGSSASLFTIRVYDSNVPGAAQSIAIDTSKNTWSYKSSDANAVVLAGDATNKNPLYVTASSPHLGTYACPFCGDDADHATILVQGGQITNVDFPNAVVTQTPVFSQNVPAPTNGRVPGLYVQVLDGLIHLTNGGGSQNFTAGQFGFTPSFTQPPVILPPNPGLQFTPPPAFSSTTVASTPTGATMSNSVDCVVRDDLGRDSGGTALCGDAVVGIDSGGTKADPGAKKMYCNRRDENAPIDPSTTAQARQLVVLPSGATSMVIVSVPATAHAIGVATDLASGKVTACASSDSAVAVTVIASTTPAGSSTTATYQATVTTSGDATVTTNAADWAGPGQPNAVTVTQGGTTTTTLVPDEITLDTTPPTVSGTLTLTPAATQVTVAWTAAVDPDNMTIPAPPLRYKVVSAASADKVATLALADAITGTGVVTDYTADITSALATGLTAGTTYWFAVIAEDLSGNKSLYAAVSTTTLPKLIFVLSATHDGALGGISGADALCAGDPAATAAGGTFKALLAGPGVREACTTPNCSSGVSEHTDWVLSANTPYVNAGGDAIGTTDSNGLLPLPLTNAIGSGTSTNCWTGLTGSWITANDNCAEWSTNGADPHYGSYGVDTGTGASAIQAESNTCDAANALYCVQQ